MRLERVDLHHLRLLLIFHVIAVAIRFFAFVGELHDFGLGEDGALFEDFYSGR